MDSKKLVRTLKNLYPDAKCSLDFHTSFELLVAVILAAQCTDERVNKVTPTIFIRLPQIENYVEINILELEELVHSCGFYKNKAKNIKECAKIIIEKYDSKVPSEMDELLKLPGIGRKSANVILLEAFNIPSGIAVDTHAKRISNRLGLTISQDPIKIEQDLLAYFSIDQIRDINHLLMWHGRNLCIAQNPRCEICPLKKDCKYFLCLKK